MGLERLGDEALRVGDWLVAPRNLEISRDGRSVRLQPRVMEVLLLLAGAGGQVVTRQELIDAAWQGRIVTDDAVNRCIGELRRALDTVDGPSSVETIPKVGYRLTLAVTRTATPAPEPRHEQEDKAAPAREAASGVPVDRERNRWRLLLAALPVLVLLIVLASLARDPTGPDPERVGTAPVSPVSETAPQLPEPPPASVAVLTWRNLSGDPAGQLVADGLAIELTDRLARWPGLHVTARSSVLALAGQDLDVARLGALLRARYLIDGTLRQERGQLRVSSQLVDSVTGYHLWSETVDADPYDVFGLQSRVADAFSEVLAAHVGGPQPLDRSPRRNPEAYRAYLQARADEQLGAGTDWSKVLSSYQAAVALDADFAAAHAGVGRAHLHLNRSLAHDQADRLDALVLPHLRRALELDPALGDAYVTRGWLLRWTRRPGGGEAYRAAVEVSPNNAIAHQSLAVFEFQNGHYGRALELVRRALELDPMSSVSLGLYHTLLAAFGEERELRESLARMHAHVEREGPGAALRCFGYQLLGQPHAALRCGWEAEARHPGYSGLMHARLVAAQALGDDAAAEAELQRLQAAGDARAGYRLQALRQESEALRTLGQAASSDPPALEDGIALAGALAQLGEGRLARDVLIAVRADRIASSESVVSHGAVQALPLVVALEFEHGDRERAGLLLDVLLQLSARPLADGAVGPQVRLLRAQALALAGREEDALHQLAAASSALGSPWDVDEFAGHPALASLRDHPRAAAAFESVRARQAELRAEYATLTRSAAAGSTPAGAGAE